MTSSKPPARAPSPRCNAPSQRPLSLRLKSNLDARSRSILQQICNGLPELTGGAIGIRVLPHLKAHRGKLLSGLQQPGAPVHAASFIRTREIVLETQLLRRPAKLRLILTHEIFHFVWARLGNPRRAAYTALIAAELAPHAQGELGESSATWKHADPKNYICESFCDSAACFYSGVKKSPEFTLAPRWRTRRQTWFEQTFAITPQRRTSK